MNSFKMQRFWNILRSPFFLRVFLLLAFMVVIMIVVTPALAQEEYPWSAQRRIPGFHPETEPPVLVADQNRTLHAFSSQWLGDDEDQAVKVIVYNQWTPDGGWTVPVDIFMPLLKKQARIVDAFLDNSGMMHIIFYSGDSNQANIYYSKAPANRAGEAPSWSKPIPVGEAPNEVNVAALEGDDQGNLVIIYSAVLPDHGLYILYSADEGATWTEPEPVFLPYFENFPLTLKLFAGQSGSIHAVWDARNSLGQGRQINYARLNLEDRQWSEPVMLAEQPVGYGVLFPTIVEHNGEVLVAYSEVFPASADENIGRPSGVTVRRSEDDGNTWSDPVNPFPHVGINGVMSFVVDSNEDLHLLWSQRTLGNPAIHGVWHSTWKDEIWTEPEDVVSGLGVRDLVGDEAFDPFDVRASVVQGNVLIATWRSDPGLNGNGVWYSYITIDAPELPVLLLPTVPAVIEAGNVDDKTIEMPEPTREAIPEFRDEADLPEIVARNPSESLFIGLVPVTLLILSIFVVRQFSQKRHH